MSTIRVDRITPYQSGSVAIEGLNITNLTIDGTLTASLQQGYVWVGGSGNVSTLTPTSSFAGGGGSDITALNAFTASADDRLDNLESATSSLEGQVGLLNSYTESADGRLDNLESATSSLQNEVDAIKIFTQSADIVLGNLETFTSSQENLNTTFAITGSNTFVGIQTVSGSILVSGSINSDGYELEASSTIVVPTLNSTFNLNLSSSSTPLVTKVLPLGDGKILVAGKFESIDGHATAKIGRLNSDGTVDTSFTAQIGNSDFYQVSSFATQSDNKIIVVGQFNTIDGNGVKSIGRLNANGSHDTTFTNASGYNVGGNLLDVIVQNDNKITVVGGFAGQKILRFNTDGTVDSSLSVPFATSSNVFGTIALQTTNSIDYLLVGGDFESFDTASDFKLFARLDISGALDTTFAGSNLLISSGGIDQINKIKLDSNNDIYIAGRFTGGVGFTQHANIARISTEDNGDGRGAFDSSFAAYTNGAVYDFDFYDNDKILIGGEFTQAGVYASQQSRNKFAVIRRDNGNITSSYSFSDYNLNDTVLTVANVPSTTNALLGGYFTQINSTSRDNLASVKLSEFGTISSSADYSITANTTELLISSSNTRFSGAITASVISGSFVGDGSGLINLVLPSGVVSGSSQLTSSLDSRYLNVSGEGTISGSFTGSFVGDGSGLTDITLPSGILSSSVTNFTDFSQSVDTRIDNIVTGTGFATTSSFNALTESFNSFTTSQEVLNVTFATTGSNTFFGNEVITGSFSVSGSISQVGVGGPGNIFIGDEPSTNMTSEAQYNVIIGQDAGILNSSGSLNVFIGKSAGLLNQIGNSNVMIGGYAGYNTKNSQNLYIGESAGFNNIMGTSNVFIGHQSGYSNKVSNNTFIGYQAGFDNTSGSENTFVGRGSGENNTTADNNSFFGYNSGRDNSVGENNTFLGNFAGQTNTSGSYNTFVGSSAGQNHKTAVYNTFVGMNAGLNTGVGNENTFIGFQAGNNNLSGSQCTLIGANANGLSTFSNYVTAVGYGAAYGVLTGSNSVYLGNAAGRYLSDGMTNVTSNTNSVFIGTDSKSNLNAQDNQIVIGYNAVSNGTNTVTIGNNDITDTYVKGTLRASTAILAQVSASYNFADDTAAAGGGVPLGGLYHTSGSIKIRLV